MARRSLTPRQLQLQEALAQLKVERVALREQQLRVAAARRVVDSLSRCDWCGAKTLATGAELQLCFDCDRQRAALARRELLARYGYAADGSKLPRPAAA